ncbi:MAG TPA: hypothetical protein VFK14_03425 [Solirubrobacterales bacterium]|nr:hypothetical protein [Solirubrobacterales bacterium]
MTEWNDDRLDELNERVKEGFACVDKRFEQVDKRFEQVEKRFEQVEKRFDEVDERFVRIETEMKAGFAYMGKRIDAGYEAINGRFDRLYYAILVTIVGLAGSLLANNVWG